MTRSRSRGLRLTRIALFSLAGGCAAIGVAGTARAETGDGVAATGASVDGLGWWHEKNVPASTPAAVVTLPPPPGVPEETLAVGAVNGEPDKIAAIGIVPEASLGDTPLRLQLVMAEAEPPAANVATDSAVIVACPITSFWVAAENGTWETRPEYDCDAAKVAGTRSADGTWTFDLTPIAQLWLAPDTTVPADGVVLVEDVEAPAGFQAVFATSGDGAITVTYEGMAGPATDAFDSVSPVVPSAPSGVASGSIGLGSPSLGLPGLGSAPVAPRPAAAAPAASASPAPAERTAAPGTPIGAVSPNVLGNLPPATALLAAAFLAMTGLLTYTLGPAGEPSVAIHQRGVSRALAARSAGGSTPPTSMETP